ncbi:MAG: hypothetical protein MJA29_03250 [Candidatus Omnitrophica bacterium]|nr:hypothetical protein [Candidatus Omnitrophota bacterium]
MESVEVNFILLIYGQTLRIFTQKFKCRDINDNSISVMKILLFNLPRYSKFRDEEWKNMSPHVCPKCRNGGFLLWLLLANKTFSHFCNKGFGYIGVGLCCFIPKIRLNCEESYVDTQLGGGGIKAQAWGVKALGTPPLSPLTQI